MLLYGASGHSKVIIDCLNATRQKVEIIFDDDESKKTFSGIEVVNNYSSEILPEEEIIIAIGENLIRKKISEKIKHRYGKAIHPSSIICDNVEVGEGSVVFHNAVIQSSASIGRHAIINTSASIDHDCIIEDFAHVSPNATLSGNVKIGEGTHIGSAAVVIPNMKIGKWCKIGAGAVIIKDIPDYSVVVGNPGRIIKENKV